MVNGTTTLPPGGANANLENGEYPYRSRQTLVRDDVAFRPAVNPDIAIIRASERFDAGESVFGLAPVIQK